MKLFITIPVASCSYESTFCKLSLVKTKLKSRVKQGCLDAIMLIFVEHELASQINYENVIDKLKNLHLFDQRLELQ
jgi:hypothetical protein